MQKQDTLLPEVFIPVVIVGAQFVIKLCTNKLHLTLLSFKKYMEEEVIVMAALSPSYSSPIIIL